MKTTFCNFINKNSAFLLAFSAFALPTFKVYANCAPQDSLCHDMNVFAASVTDISQAVAANQALNVPAIIGDGGDIANFKAAIADALTHPPATATTPQQLQDYQNLMNMLASALNDLDTACVANDITGAQAALSKLQTIKKSGHTEFNNN